MMSHEDVKAVEGVEGEGVEGRAKSVWVDEFFIVVVRAHISWSMRGSGSGGRDVRTERGSAWPDGDPGR
jgi:hypothetical protein